MKFNPSNNFLAQTAHFLSGLCIVWGPAAIWPASIWTDWPIFTGGYVFYMLIKEIFVDPRLEGEPFLNHGLEDCVWGFAGLFIGWITLIW